MITTTSALPIGLVLPDLEAYRDLVHAIATAAFVTEVEFTYGAPLFKGNDAIVEGLKGAVSALDKFDVYFRHGILDEAARVKLAQGFRLRYLNRHPYSEGSDVFAASADVLQFRFRLMDPRQLDDGPRALVTARQQPHDGDVLSALEKDAPIDNAHLKGRVKLFLDHVYNPRRRKLPEVQAVMTGRRAKDPVIVELETSGALPGLFAHLLEPLVKGAGGALVWLPG